MRQLIAFFAIATLFFVPQAMAQNEDYEQLPVNITVGAGIDLTILETSIDLSFVDGSTDVITEAMTVGVTYDGAAGGTEVRIKAACGGNGFVDLTDWQNFVMAGGVTLNSTTGLPWESGIDLVPHYGPASLSRGDRIYTSPALPVNTSEVYDVQFDTALWTFGPGVFEGVISLFAWVQ